MPDPQNIPIRTPEGTAIRDALVEALDVVEIDFSNIELRIMEDVMPDAPWTQTQVDALNRFQREGRMHPFTCPGDKPGCKNNRELIATTSGWVCVCGAYTQTWAHGFMMQQPSDWSDGSFYAATSREQDPEGYDKTALELRDQIGDQLGEPE